MKKCSYTFTALRIFVFLIFPINLNAQVTIEKKPIIIVNVGITTWPACIDREISNSDTSYSLVFRDSQYKELTEIKVVHFTKPELLELAKGLTAVQTAEPGVSYPPPVLDR